MKKLLHLTKEQLSVYICPLLLADAVYFASLYTFNKPSAFVFTALFAIASVMLFRLFDSLRLRKNGGLIYALMLSVAVFVSFSLVVLHMSAYGYYSPIRWFYAQGDDSFVPDLTAALALGGGFFLCSVIYYFTMVRYRTMGVMLCTMFPFFFFAKRSDIMPNILITLIMLLFLAVVIHNRRLGSGGEKTKSELKVDRAYIIAVSVFILIVGSLTMIIEKPYYQAFLEKNSRLFTPFGIGGGNSSGFEDLTERSSPRNGRPDYNYEPLFYAETDSDAEELFLRTKAFDTFDGDFWVNSNNYSWAFYSLQLPEYSTDDVALDMSALTGGEPTELYRVQRARVFDDEFTPSYLPSPYGIITDNRPANSLQYYKLRSDTSVFRTMDYYDLPELNDRFSFIEGSHELYLFAERLNFSSSEYLDFLNGFGQNESAKRLLKDYERAQSGYTGQENISSSLRALSEEITADCHSDLEKAKALESYFSESGFSYSLDYVPDDNSVDYFVFQSKTGYCAGYATAMTLMARSVGLPARYVEGFAAFEKNESGQFVIRDGYAHAFVEVYIPAAGWLTFDPTVDGYRENPNADGSSGIGILSRLLEALNRASSIFVIALAVLLFSLADLLRELAFRTVILFKPLEERVILLYRNLLKAAGKSVGEDLSSYTPDMLRKLLYESKGVSSDRLISLFEKTAFGGFKVKREEYAPAYREYKSCYRKLSRRFKNSKSHNRKQN